MPAGLMQLEMRLFHAIDTTLHPVSLEAAEDVDKS